MFSSPTERKVFRTFNVSPFLELDMLFINLSNMFQERKLVILIFTVQDMKQFCGLAQLNSTNGGDVNSACQVTWLSTDMVPYDLVK